MLNAGCGVTLSAYTLPHQAEAVVRASRFLRQTISSSDEYHQNRRYSSPDVAVAADGFHHHICQRIIAIGVQAERRLPCHLPRNMRRCGRRLHL